MNRAYKFVSGKGRVEMSQSEINELASDFPLPEKESPSLSELSDKVEKILKILESLKLISSFSNLGGGENNGNS